jgi:uncharacterized membrane protein
MQISTEALVAILGMAIVTMAIKAGGLLIADRLPRTGFAAAWISHIPGAVLAALVAPAVVSGTIAEVVAALATGAMFLVTRSLIAAMAAGVAVVYVTRLLIAG